MANAKPSKSSEANAEKQPNGLPREKVITSRSELKGDAEAKFKVLVDGTESNPNYRKYQLPDGTIKEVR